MLRCRSRFQSPARGLALGAALLSVAVTVPPVLAQPSPTKDAVLASIDEVVTSMMKEWQVPGLALGIVRDGQVYYLKGYGDRDIERGLPVTPRTLMPIGSNTKSFTALLAGMLVDEKRIAWDAPVRRYLPDFQLQDAYATEHLTVRDLLRHNSGLSRHDLTWYDERPVTRQGLYERLRYLEPSASFREKWQYQNQMFLTAGLLMERVTGQSWEDLIATRILGPLRMSRSLPIAATMHSSDDFSLAYRKQGGAVVVMPFHNLDVMGPAGSMVSSVEDMVKYLQYRLDRGRSVSGPRISVEAEDQMQTAQMVVGEPSSSDIWPDFDHVTYGLGLAIATYRDHPVVVHGGGTANYLSQMSWMPRDKIGVVVLTNLAGNPIWTMVLKAVYDRLLGLPPIDYAAAQRTKEAEAKRRAEAARQGLLATRKPGTSPSHDLSAYVGNYDNPGYGRVVIRPAASGLELVLAPMVAPLRHWHYDVFEVDGAANGVLLGGLATFSTGVRGDIDQVALTLDPSVRPITFKRAP